MKLGKLAGVVVKAVRKTMADNAAEAVKTLRLDGRETCTVYTYVPKPLAWMERGDEVWLTCDDAPLTLRSTVTGTVWETHGRPDEDVPLLYKGKPIGFLGGGRSPEIREAIAMGLTVQVRVTCSAKATKQRPYPMLTAHTPSGRAIRQQAEALA